MSIPASWVKFKDVPNSPEALALGAFLESNGVPVYLEHLSELPGIDLGAIVAVPESLLHRARWLTVDRDFSDEELTDLALGEDSGETPAESDDATGG